MDLLLRDCALILGSFLESDISISHFTTDSRRCRKGSLFVALKGEKYDGHDFLNDAWAHGASAAIVSKKGLPSFEGFPCILVEDSLKALQLLAKKALESIQPLVIGITGSVGKTTTKEFIATILSEEFTVAKTPESYNGQIGLPLTILNANSNAKVFVLEMGISYPGEMSKLVEIAPCHIACVTKVCCAHYANFSNLDEIAKEKSTLLQQPYLKKGFYFSENQKFQTFQTLSSICSPYHVDSLLGFDLPFEEKHLKENLALAVRIALHLGVAKEKIQKGIKALALPVHRFQKRTLENIPSLTIIDDTYNSNPIALKTALLSIRLPKVKGRKIGIIGEMKELGSLSILAHAELGIIASLTLDAVFAYGKESKPLYERVVLSGKKGFFFEDKEKLCDALIAYTEENDLLFFKASNSNRLWECIDQLEKKQKEMKTFSFL